MAQAPPSRIPSLPLPPTTTLPASPATADDLSARVARAERRALELLAGGQEARDRGLAALASEVEAIARAIAVERQRQRRGSEAIAAAAGG